MLENAYIKQGGEKAQSMESQQKQSTICNDTFLLFFLATDCPRAFSRSFYQCQPSLLGSLMCLVALEPHEIGTPTLIRTGRALPLEQGRRPGRSVYRTPLAKKKPHSMHQDENRPPLALPELGHPGVMFLLYTQKGSSVQHDSTRKIKHNIISLPTLSSQINFLGLEALMEMNYYQENSATKESSVKIVKPYTALQPGSSFYSLKINRTNGNNKATFLNLKKLQIIIKTKFQYHYMQ